MTATAPTPGERFTVEIDGLGYGGAGLCRLPSGRRVRVPRVLPGERVLVEVTRCRVHRIDARKIALDRPAPDRVAPGCVVFERCGGCALQHLDYRAQLASKVATLKQRLERALGDRGVACLQPAAGADAVLGYRTRNQFAVRDGVVGFRNAHGEGMVDVPTCPLATSTTTPVLAAVRGWLARRGHDGVRTVTIRTGTAGSLLVFGLLAGALPGDLSALAASLPDTGIFTTTVDDDGNAIPHAPLHHHHGPERLADRLGGFALSLTPRSFAQTNPGMATRIYRHLVAALSPGPMDRVLDLFAGSGGLSLHLACAAGSVLGVELQHPATLDATATAAANGVANVAFRCGKAETIARRLFLAGQQFPIVTMNPPRTGLPRELLPWLPRLRARRLGYVSCSPATLVRDLVRLAELGYELRQLTPFDLFPQTSHLEVVAILDSSRALPADPALHGSPP